MQPQKHIALFLHELAGGGAERVMVNLANSMAGQNIRVDMVLVRKSGVYLKDLDSRVTIVTLNKKRTLFSILALAKYLHREKPAALLSALEHVNIAAIIAGKLSHTKTHIAISEHGYVLKPSSHEKFTIKIIYYLRQLLYPMADKIIAVSDGVKQSLVESLNIDDSRIHIIYNPIVSKKLLDSAKEKPQHRWLGNKKHKIILAIGRLHEVKDYPTLINAFALLLKKTAARLIILGEGDERPALERLINTLQIQEKIDMPGFAENPFSYMANADILVLSSKFEGFGNVIVEAMACGTAVVATKTSGASEIIGNNEYGLLSPIGNAEILAENIEKMLNNPTNPELLKKRSNDFDCDKITKQYLDILLP